MENYVNDRGNVIIEPKMTSREIEGYIRRVYYGDIPHPLAITVLKIKLVDNIYEKLCR